MPTKQKEYFVYIMSNKIVTVLYVGSTNNLIRRIWQHKHKLFDNSFTKKYNINKLLYFETQPNKQSAWQREKEIKSWNRNKKLELIKKINPDLKDLSEVWKYIRF